MPGWEMPRAGTNGEPSQERTTVNRVTSGLLMLGLTTTLALNADHARDRKAAWPMAWPPLTLLDLHPANPANYPDAALTGGLPRVVSAGNTGAAPGDPRQVRMPTVVTPSQSVDEASGNADGKAGTGFFI